MLAWPCHHRGWPEHHRAPPLSHHAHRRASSGDPLSKPRVPIGAEEDGEHVGADLVAGDFADGEFSPIKVAALLGFTDVWGKLTHGAQSSVPLWCIDRVHLAVRV